MVKYKAALYCHADRKLPQEKLEQELRRQQALLESYADTHEIELSACYLHAGPEYLDLNELVLLHMLQAAKRKEFDMILLECFERFPVCSPENIPPLRLFSVAENRLIEIGKGNASVFDESPELPAGAAVYIRDGSRAYQWNLRFSD